MTNEVQQEDKPEKGTTAWTQYIIDQLEDDEMREGKPLVSGLRRLAEKELGMIVFSGPTEICPSTDTQRIGRASATYMVTFENGVSYADAADCYIENCDDTFAVHTLAMAVTRAESRALRKALQLKIVSAEEITSKDTGKLVAASQRVAAESAPGNEDNTQELPISSQQNGAIDVMCDKYDIDRNKLFTVVLGVPRTKTITRAMGTEAIKTLNTYQRDKTSIPEEIKL